MGRALKYAQFGCPDGNVTCISFWTSHLCTHARCGGKSTYLAIVDKILSFVYIYI